MANPLRVLVADALAEAPMAQLASQYDVRSEPDHGEHDLPDAVGDAQVLVVRSTRVNAQVFGAARDLALVIRAGSGTDTIDLAAAQAAGVAVANVPGRNAAAVAELAVGLMLALDRRLVDQVNDLRAGRWRKGDYQSAQGIAGRRVGIAGFGAIGAAVAQRMAAFGCPIATTRATRSAERIHQMEQLGVEVVDDISALASVSDILSFHLPLTDATRHIIGQPLLSQVKHGAMLINTARGALVDEAALIEVIDDKQLLVGLDVHPDEPPSSAAAFTSRLVAHPRVIGTHHCGASTQQAQESVAEGVADIIAAFARGEVRHQVGPSAPASP